MDLNTLFKFVDNLNMESLYLNKKLCPNVRARKICDACKRYCPTKAIQVSGDIDIDKTGCVGCGICATVCPNGVFELVDKPDTTILFEIDEQLTKNHAVTFICTKCDGTLGKVKTKRKRLKSSGEQKRAGWIKVPCLGRVQEVFILQAWIAGAKQVNFANEYCDKSCVCYPQKSIILEQIIWLSNHLLRAFGAEIKDRTNPKPIDIGVNDTNTTEVGTRIGASTRREIISRSISSGVTEAVKFAIPLNLNLDDEANKNEEKEQYWSQFLPTKRLILSKLAKNFNTKSYTIKRKLHEKLPFPFAELEIQPLKCTHCETCTYVCPTGALTSLELDEYKLIYFLFFKCTGCELCSRMCPEHAIGIKNTVDLAKLNCPARILIKHTMRTCKKCGMKFIKLSSKSNLCLQCEKRQRIEAGIQQIN